MSHLLVQVDSEARAHYQPIGYSAALGRMRSIGFFRFPALPDIVGCGMLMFSGERESFLDYHN